MTRERRLAASVAILAATTVLGTIGYVLIEGAPFLDALFMTVITISTVGFREVFDLSVAGQVLTVAVIIVGVGAGLYTAATALELGLERFIGGERERRRMGKEISSLEGHVILCGFGRVGRNTWTELQETGTPTVVVEVDPELTEEARRAGALVVTGDATADATLAAAGIDRARALVACVRSDADNLVIVLSARHRRRDLLVVARAAEIASEHKLRLAGADRVVVPQMVGAERLAALATRPRLDEFVDLFLHGKLVELQIEEFAVGKDSVLVGTLLRDSRIREDTGAMVLAIETPAGHLTFNPPPETPIQPGHTLIGMGSQGQLDALRERLEP
jgi:voltage-gated potassium channel